MTRAGRSMVKPFFVLALVYLYMGVDYTLEHEITNAACMFTGSILSISVALWARVR